MWLTLHEMYSVCEEVGLKLISGEEPDFVSLWGFIPSEEETIMEFYMLDKDVLIHSISNDTHSFYFKDRRSVREAFLDEVEIEREVGKGDDIVIEEVVGHEEIGLPIEVERDDY